MGRGMGHVVRKYTIKSNLTTSCIEECIDRSDNEVQTENKNLVEPPQPSKHLYLITINF